MYLLVLCNCSKSDYTKFKKKNQITWLHILVLVETQSIGLSIVPNLQTILTDPIDCVPILFLGDTYIIIMFGSFYIMSCDTT